MSLWTRLTRALLSPALDGPPAFPPRPDHASPRPFRRSPHPAAQRPAPPQRPKAARASRPSPLAAEPHPPQPPKPPAAVLESPDPHAQQPPPQPPQTAPATLRHRPFRPTTKQRALAEAACGLDLPLRTNLLCSRAQVSLRSFYRWQSQPGFNAWFAAAVLQALATATPLLILSAMQSAIDGDSAARKLMFQYCVSPELSPAIASQLGWADRAGEYHDDRAQPPEEPVPPRRLPRSASRIPPALPPEIQSAGSTAESMPSQPNPAQPAARPPRLPGVRPAIWEFALRSILGVRPAFWGVRLSAGPRPS